MKLVERDFGIRQMLCDTLDKSRAHVDAHIGDLRRIATVLDQIIGKRGDGCGIAAFGDVNDAGLVDIDEQRDIIVAAPGCGFINRDAGDVGGIDARAGFFDIMVDYPPQPGVVFAHQAFGGFDRHGGDHGHDQCLEQERKTAAVARPRHADFAHATSLAFHPRDAGVQIGLMLEEIQMAPAHGRGVMRGAAGGAALRAGKTAAGREVDMDVQPAGIGVEISPRHHPRRGQAEGQLQQMRVTHDALPARSPRPATA